MIFCLGTAQLGMPYGIVNDTGQPSGVEASELVGHAVDCGITCFDTAREYGRSEEILGDVLSKNNRSGLQVITKLGISAVREQTSEACVRQAVDQSIQRSCDALRSQVLDVVLLHRWQHRLCWNGAAWGRLLELKTEGRIRNLGASIYEPWEAMEALGEAQITFLQMPMNVLDWRWRESGIESVIQRRNNLSVHFRSVLLQGILAHPANRWPVVGDFDSEGCVSTLRQLAKRLGRESVTDLCFAYARSLRWGSAVVVGCETQAQLRHDLHFFSRPVLTPDESRQLEREIPKVPETLLNPSRWSILHEPHACCAS